MSLIRRSSRRLFIPIAAFMLTAVLPHAAPAGLNVWTSTGPQSPGVNAVATGVIGYMPFLGSTAQARIGFGIPVVYSGTAGEGVFRSLDLGASWQPANAGLEHTYIESLLVDAGRPAVVYAASPNRGVFKSTDAGNVWTEMNTGLPSPSAHRMAADLGTGALYVTNNAGLFVSADGGESWCPTALQTGRDNGDGEIVLNDWIDCLAADSTTHAVYACFFSWNSAPQPAWRLLRSADGGDSWASVELPSGSAPVAIAIDRAMPGVVYVATYDLTGDGPRVLRSTDDGASWTQLGGALPGCGQFCRVTALSVDSYRAPIVYAATDNGIYSLREDAGAWAPFNTGLAGLQVDSVAVDAVLPGIVHAGTPAGAFSILRHGGMCAGDCDGDGSVRVPELVSMVGIAQDEHRMAACGAGDHGGDGRIAVDELVMAVGNALAGCHASGAD